MRCLALAALLVLTVTACTACGTREGTEPVGEPNAFATVTSVSRPPLALVRWMDRICGVTGWLADTSTAGRDPRDVDVYLATAVVYVDLRIAVLTSLPKTYTDGDALAANLTAALRDVRPEVVTLTTGARTAPPPDKLSRAAEVAGLLDQARAAGPTVTELIATDPVLESAHSVAASC